MNPVKKRKSFQARRYIQFFSLSFFVVLGVTALINYKMDPGGIFGDQTAYEVAQLLLDEKNVVITGAGCNGRRIGEYYVQGMKDSREILVFGSSRSWEVRKSMFPGRTFFNQSGSVASLEDYLAFYEMYYMRNLKPKIVILGLDPWLLNRSNGLSNWKFLKHYYFEMTKRLNISPNLQRVQAFSSNKYLELVSLGYLRESLPKFIKSVFSLQQTDKSYYTTQKDNAGYQVHRADGTTGFETGYINKTTNEVLVEAISYGKSKNVPGMISFTRLDHKLTQAFEAFVLFLQSQDIDVIFFLPPYHPKAYELLVHNEYEIILEVQTYFEQVALEFGILLVGSYDPADCNCEETEFFDSRHPKESCVQKIFSNTALEKL